MLFLFAFFLGGFPLSDVVLNFISLHQGVRGFSVASTGTPGNPGTPGRHGLHINAPAKITVNYLQAEIPVHRDHINRPIDLCSL